MYVQTDRYEEAASCAWYPWQPQWNFVKEKWVFSFQQTERRDLAEGQDAINT